MMFSTAAVLFNVILVAMVTAAPTPPECKKPEDLHVQYNKLANNSGLGKFLLPNEFARVGNSDDNSVKEIGDKRCPSVAASGMDDKVDARSLCPWYTKITHNATRFPSVFQEAVCRCQDCINSDTRARCEPVQRQFSFLARTNTCVDGLYVYVQESVHLSVACVCAKKRRNDSSVDDGQLAQ